jgi:hypothetical protein
MKIESMEGYRGNLGMNRPLVDANLSQLWGQISALMKNIQELTMTRPGRSHVWCTRFYKEGHLANECPHMRGMGPLHNPMGPYSGPTGGVAQVSSTPSFHTPWLYNSFPGAQTSQTTEYCEICRMHGHVPRKCPIMHKYMTSPNTIHCDFYTSTTHATNQCRALDALSNILDRTTFRINETPLGPRRGQGGGARGGFKGGINGGIGIICYNYNEKFHLSRDFPHPRQPWCSYYKNNGHATKDCPDLITKWEDRVRQRESNIISSELKI